VRRPSALSRPWWWITASGAPGARPRAAERLCAHLGLTPVHLDLSGVGESFREGLERRPHVPLPHRNLVILALAVSYASRGGISRVALGLNRDDLEAYPSATPALS
jgi:7-cyano-7-deazaguanine synthase